MQYYPNLETRKDLKNKLGYPRQRVKYVVWRKNKTRQKQHNQNSVSENWSRNSKWLDQNSNLKVTQRVR